MVNRSAKSAAFVLAVLFAIAGCSGSGERGFKSSEPEFMQELKVELKKSGIPFSEDPDGSLKYPAKYESAVKTARTRVDQELHSGVLVRYDDDQSLDYLKTLLTAQGLKYRVEVKKDGEWVRWYPQNKAQEKQINLKVVEHQFDAECAKSPSHCASK